MNTKPVKQLLWIPIAIAVAVLVGIFFGLRFPNDNKVAENDRKLNAILNLIAQDYVDTTNLNDLIELSIPEILGYLDPHTSYFTAEDLKAATDDLNGTFSGIGISFVMVNDTIGVVEVISGGPSEKVGLMAGDKIVTIDDTVATGPKMTNSEVMKRLRGAKGTKVKLGIKRQNTNKTLTFTVTRGDIPVNSVDAYYMIDNITGYVKVNQFGRHTYDEFITALASLDEEGAERYIIDLRSNGGGFMEMAVLMANEFLPADQSIVFTKGRDSRDDTELWSDGNGSFQNAELAVIIDEFSASASEIFAGAMQDNDRGLIVGCRSFGKGLVQKEFILPDESAIRLTTARYYTPSGRCIQKDYKEGMLNYEKEVLERYLNGELYSRDSMKIDRSQVFTTLYGRTVYGGGGIVPDIFVARDTSGFTSYYIDVANAGLLQRYAFNYCNNHRAALSKMKDYTEFLRTAPSDEALLKDFADYASRNGVAPRWYYINLSSDIIVTNLKALIARDTFGSQAFYPILNRKDNTILEALKALNQHKAAFPIRD
ncbi:MAG: S41 family peptidase [Muribaculaceae bacterium]|nr:S41 family peptidase [Muribaculaceae bacterium]